MRGTSDHGRKVSETTVRSIRDSCIKLKKKSAKRIPFFIHQQDKNLCISLSLILTVVENSGICKFSRIYFIEFEN